jgi:ADP-ribosylarginine hydrolase
MEKRYMACMVLHAVGDAIGYKNGEWEFKRGSLTKAVEKLYEFIDLGGINHIDLKGWRVSDDTILHMKTAEGLLEDYKNINTLSEILVKKYIEAYNQFESEGFEYRSPGNTTMRSIVQLISGRLWNETPYDFYSGGSGASMRSSCIGLAYYGEKSRDMLIQVAIESSRITHNSVVGYLGGLTAALFTALAIEGVDIKSWPFKLMELYNRGRIDKYIEKAGRDVNEYKEDANIFFEKWDRYIADKFDKDGNVIKRRSNINVVLRSQYYYLNFGFKETKTGEKVVFPGSGGDDSVIIAYDCLIDAQDSWEKLVIYSMLNAGDGDTTGCIAGSWYGALKGFQDVTPLNIKHLEYREKLENIGRKLFNKYHK